MQKKGLISVLCLSMNHERFVKQACASVLNQTYKQLEVLYVDNNSRDKTFETADEIFRNSGLPYKGFKRTENYGISANLNFLMQKAAGEFIAVLSADDWWDPDNLKIKIELFNENADYGLIYANGYKYFESDHTQHLFYKTVQKSGLLFNDLLKGNLFFAGSVVSRYAALCGIGGFDEELPMEDWDMYLRMAKKYKIGYIHQPLSYSRVTGSNLSSNIPFMNKGYEIYFKKYAKYPEMAEAKKNIRLAQAFQLASDSPGIKSLMYILRNLQWNSSYFKQVIRCCAAMVRIKIVPRKKM